MQNTPSAFPKTHFEEKTPGSSNEPVMVTADRMDYDRDKNTVTAIGHVEVVQGASIMLADKMTYFQDQDMVRASGHVSMLETSGNVYFADEIELENGFKQGVVEEFKLRMIDDSVLVAAHATKVDENVTLMNKAVYTPCTIDCTRTPDGSAMWSLNAQEAKIDEQAQKITYHNAYFDVFGIPVLYTPYMSQPTPGADNQSGLLVPSYEHNSNVGSIFRAPVYYSIARDRDVTITPIETTIGGPVMQVDYREMFNEGPLDINGSVTNAPNYDAFGNHEPGEVVRGDINAVGTFKIDQNYDWGIDAHRTTDDTYLRIYDLGNDTLLTSRLYGEGQNFAINNRSYGIVQALSFQGLTTEDQPKITASVGPLMDISLQSNPGWNNSRFTFDGDAMSLYRDEGDESRRLSGTTGWKLPYLTDSGQVMELSTQLRSDLYSVNDLPLSNGTIFDGDTGRLVPQAAMLWHYPFINRSISDSFMIEPVVNFTASPGGGNPEKIPNEDSLVPEFTDSNLFSNDRFAGLDRVEVGPRVSYGMRGQSQFLSSDYVDWLIGQEYRVDNDPNFPISNDLNSHISDYVGKVGITDLPVTLAYRFRLDKDNLSPRRSEIDSGYTMTPLNLSISYLSLKDDPILANKESIVGNADINLTKEWTWNVNVGRDLLLNQMVSAGTGLTFKNECTNFIFTLSRAYTEDSDLKPSTNFMFRIALKNLE